jgi:hypothetical protein
MREGQGGTGSLWVPFPLPVPRPPDHRRNGQQSSTHSEHCQRPAIEPTRSSSSRIPAGAFKLQSKHLCDWRESAASSILLLVRGAYRGPYRMGTAVMGVVVMGLAADIYFRGLAGIEGFEGCLVKERRGTSLDTIPNRHGVEFGFGCRRDRRFDGELRTRLIPRLLLSNSVLDGFGEQLADLLAI